MAGLIFAPTIVSGASELTLAISDRAHWTERARYSLDARETKAPESAGVLFSGHSRGPYRVTLSFAFQYALINRTPAGIRAQLGRFRDVREAFVAEAAGYVFDLFVWWDAVAKKGYGYRDCTLVDLDMDKPLVVRAPARYGAHAMTVSFVAQNLDEDYIDDVDSGSAPVGPGASATPIVNTGMEIHGPLMIYNSTGTQLGYGLDPDTDVETFGGDTVLA